jgi:hypothetical protein
MINGRYISGMVASTARLVGAAAEKARALIQPVSEAIVPVRRPIRMPADHGLASAAPVTFG